jgi:hypothetical protein
MTGDARTETDQMSVIGTRVVRKRSDTRVDVASGEILVRASPGTSATVRTLFVGEERRRHAAQRRAVEHELSRARGRTAVVRFDDGAVYVYDEQREGPRPGTRRVRITDSGEIDAREFLPF